jgi:lysophospholipid acyltransferase (LPLAT)-like uncharacterized protein
VVSHIEPKIAFREACTANLTALEMKTMRISPDLVSPLLALVYRVWIQTLCFEDEGGLKRIAEAADSGRPVVLAFWHAELFALGSYCARYLPGRLATIVSESSDGELVAQIIRRIGYGTARGSSTRGGMKALSGLKDYMEQGRIGVITVDGPRGPRHKVKDGAAYLAHRTGALLFPLRSKPLGMHVFERSWDHFQLPWPFARCLVRVGQALEFQGGKTSPEMLVRDGLRLETAMHDTLPSAD